MDKKERYVSWCERKIREGYPKDRIIKKLPKELAEEIFEIARCRIDMRDKFSKHRLYFDRYGLRYSTPEIIGRYRAERIKNYRIADVSCGAGMQAIFFSFTNKEVLGVDLSEKRIDCARRNAKAYNAKNIRFIVGDCFSNEVHKIAKDYDVIFSDPARDESEPERKLETLHPSPLKIMDRYGTKNYIFDLPPQISQSHLPHEWEKEYVSINRRITRLTTYTGELKQHNRIAVSLPSKSIFWSDSPQVKDVKVIKERVLSDYIYLVDESLYYSKLLGEFAEEVGVEYVSIGKRRTIATGDDLHTPFLDKFIVLCRGAFDDVLDCMAKNGFGKLTLRFSISPDTYWKVRRKIEAKLRGDKKGSLFKIGETWLGAENVT